MSLTHYDLGKSLENTGEYIDSAVVYALSNKSYLEDIRRFLGNKLPAKNKKVSMKHYQNELAKAYRALEAIEERNCSIESFARKAGVQNVRTRKLIKELYEKDQ